MKIKLKKEQPKQKKKQINKLRLLYIIQNIVHIIYDYSEKMHVIHSYNNPINVFVKNHIV